jgi:hypothetical protein
MAVFAFGRPVWVLAAGMLLKGAGRALDSGPLESWYVDSAHAVDRAADLKPALARSAAACAVALATGSLAGGALVVLAPLPDAGDAVALSLSVPYLVAMAFGLLSLLFVALWVTDTIVADNRPTWRSVVRDVPRTVRAGSRLAAASPVLRRLGARSAAFGAVITAVEVLSPVQFGESAGAGAFSALVTVAFLGTALGARLGPGVARLVGGSNRALLVSTCLAALGLACLAMPWWWAAAVAYVAFYAVMGIDDPIAGELLHAETGPEQRATILSVQSAADDGRRPPGQPGRSIPGRLGRLRRELARRRGRGARIGAARDRPAVPCPLTRGIRRRAAARRTWPPAHAVAVRRACARTGRCRRRPA